MERIFLALVSIALIIYGAMNNYLNTLGSGIILLIIALFLRPKQLLQLCVVVLNVLCKTTVLEDLKKELSSELKKIYPKIQKSEFDKIYSAETLGATTAAASSIVFEHVKDVCVICGSEDCVKIEWSPEFDKLLGEKENLASKPLAYKCNNCGNKYLRYTTN